MRGASFLRKPAPPIPVHNPVAVRNEAEAAVALGLAHTTEELQSTWFLVAEPFEGAARERLQAVYTRQLRAFGVLQG